MRIMPGWPARCCGGWIWSSKRWPSWMRSIVDACQPWQHRIDLLQTIPGVGVKVAQVIIAETGADMSRFPTAAHLAYWMLKRDEPYHDLGADRHRRRNDEAHTRRLVAQLQRLGHTVIINPAA
jgi:transposase